MTLREAKRIMRGEYEQRTGFRPTRELLEKLARKLQRKDYEIRHKGK